MNLLDRILIQADVRVNYLRNKRIPKLKEEIERIERYATEVENAARRCRSGDENAMVDLVALAFPERTL